MSAQDDSRSTKYSLRRRSSTLRKLRNIPAISYKNKNTESAESKLVPSAVKETRRSWVLFPVLSKYPVGFRILI